MKTMQEMARERLFNLMRETAVGGDEHLRTWIDALDDDELVDMLATESRADGHKAGERVAHSRISTLMLERNILADACRSIHRVLSADGRFPDSMRLLAVEMELAGVAS